MNTTHLKDAARPWRWPSLARRVAVKLTSPVQPSEARLVYHLLRGAKGVMVDVGAHLGRTVAPFAQEDWRVVAFEPDPENRTALRNRYRGHGSVTVDQRAVSENVGHASFFRSPESTGVSSLHAFTDKHQPAGSVQTVPLGAALREHYVSAVDFLKIDAEAHDLFVLRSNDWSRVKPRVVMCEFEDRKTVPLGYTWRDMADLLVSHGYAVVVSEWHPVVRYGGDHKWRRFVDYPTDLADPNGHGNLLAFREPSDLAAFRPLAAEATRSASVPRYKLVFG